MIVALEAWWRALTGRERLLIQIAGALLFGLMLPLLAYQGASSYRAAAVAALEDATRLKADIASLPPPKAAPTAAAAETLPELATAAAQRLSLPLERPVETVGPGRVRIAFAAADSRTVSAFIRAMGEAGVTVVSARMQRAGEGPIVTAECVLAGAA